MNKGTAVVGFILSFIAGMMLMWGAMKSSIGTTGDDIAADQPAGAWKDDSPVPVTSDDPVWGNRNAPVTLVVFSEFECPFCSRVDATIKQVEKTYGKDKVRVVFKSNPLPFHKNARPASVAAETVRALDGNDAFWKFHDAAFQNQRDLTRENFEKWAQEAGVKDMAKFKAALDANTYAAKVDKDLALGKELGVRGTPHTLINGISVSGAQPFEKFKEVIDEQLTKAQALIKSGTKPEQVYATLTKQNRADMPAAEKPADKPAEPAEDKTVWKVPVGDSPVKGAKDAQVTLVIFSDYQCPFCKRVEGTIDQVMKDYEGKLRVVWKDQPLPFHNRAEPAAEFAREARKQQGDAGFWKAHGKLIENNTKLEDADLANYAKELGLNAAAVKTAVETKKYAKEITADQALAEALKANGTPHMFINGRRLVGAQPIEKFKSVIDEELAKADGIIKRGVAKAAVYDEIMKEAQTPPPAAAAAAAEKKNVPAPTAKNPSKGPKNAKIVVQLFSDFQCPFCGRVDPTLKQLIEANPGKVRVVWRNLPLPFHQQAVLAAEAAMEAFTQKGDDAFWKFHDKLFENQRTPGGLERPALEKYAEELGLDMARFKKALDEHTHKPVIDADMEIAKNAGITGTPGATINGYFVGGAQALPAFQKAVDQALAEAK